MQLTPLALVPEKSHASPTQVLNCLPLAVTRGKLLQFHSFDESYLERLRAGDKATQAHFSAYFTALIQVKMRSRLRSREAIEDVRQETFVRFYVALHEGKILHAERLGSYVNSMCTNILREHYRGTARLSSLDSYSNDDDDPRDFPANTADPLDALSAKETEQKVKEILEQMSERDRRVLRAVFLEERDKDEVCRDFGVDRDFLRVLLHRARQKFKTLYLKDKGTDPPELASA